MGKCWIECVFLMEHSGNDLLIPFYNCSFAKADYNFKRKTNACFTCLKKYDYTAAPAVKSLQSCLTLCNPIDGSPPYSPVPGILQARLLEWVAISFSNTQKWKVKMKFLSRVWPSATPWIAAFKAPPSMGFSRQEYWSGVPLTILLLLLLSRFSPVRLCATP